MSVTPAFTPLSTSPSIIKLEVSTLLTVILRVRPLPLPLSPSLLVSLNVKLPSFLPVTFIPVKLPLESSFPTPSNSFAYSTVAISLFTPSKVKALL